MENRFLASLPEASRAKLAPHLRRVTLVKGATVVAHGRPVAFAHLPISAQLANIVPLANGGSSEVSLIGAEGVSGLAPVLARTPCGWNITVRQQGDAWEIEGERLADCARTDEALMDRLLVLSAFYQQQSAVEATCLAHHPLSARLARFLLTADDLSPGVLLKLTQEELALALGAARTSVNVEATFYRDAGALRYARGVVAIEQRGPLERHACECYGLLRDTAVRDGLLPT